MTKDMRILWIVCLVLSSCVNSQNKKQADGIVGGPCQGCEALLEYGNRVLKAVDTLPEFGAASDPLKIYGTVYQRDGVTPAANVIIYAYHTNEKGIYPKKEASSGWEGRHGYLRGWVKTDAKGSYTFYTFRPASYPNSTIEQHVHMTVKEPNLIPYYIDDVTFTDDPFLSDRTKNRTKARGGRGLVRLTRKNGLLHAKRDIVLGQRIPNYPR